MKIAEPQTSQGLESIGGGGKSLIRKGFWAFTLAEVLITLGIIGVVAAMTLPTLIQKHQRLVLETQLKKTYTTLSQGIQKAMADDGVTSFFDTELFNVCAEGSLMSDGVCRQMAKKYFKVSTPVSLELKEYYQKLIRPEKEYIDGDYHKGVRAIVYRRDNEYKRKGSDYFYLYSLADGAQFAFSCWRDTGCDIFTDINGSKGPNTENMDIFYFRVYDQKISGTNDYVDNIYAAGSKAVMENGWKFPW